MSKLKLEILFSAVAQIDLLDALIDYGVDEEEIIEAIESNDTDKLNELVEDLEENLHLAFKGQKDVKMLDMDTERSSLSIIYDEQVLTSNN